MADQFQVRFCAAVAAAGGSGGSNEARAVVEAYASPDRRYHDVAHLQSVLDGLDELAPLARANSSEELRPHLVELAAFYHDVVYDTSAPGSEEQSAERARVELRRLGCDVFVCEKVARLVELTKGHQPDTGDIHGRWLCDADLLVLAAPADEYAAYVAAVRAEYGQYDNEQWRVGRLGVVAGLLALPRLFSLAPTATELLARANLQAELDGLRASGPGSGRA